MNDINLKRIADTLEEILRLVQENIWRREKMINEKKVDQVRKFIWDMYKELRSMRGKRKKIDIFAVEMTVMQLGVLANGMQEKEKESE
jgi:hypothetical protein